MDTKVLITIDTEPDNQWDAKLRRNPSFENISNLDKLQKLFNRFNVKPTYLVTFSVVKCSVVNLLKDIAESQECEIGTHLHAWETPPLEPSAQGDGSYLHQYSDIVQRKKLANLDSVITQAFRQKPVSYRGGRYSFDGNTIAMLAEYGYLVDTSVTPGISWENDGGANFKKYNYQDYFLTAEQSRILEVPVSIKIKTRLPAVSKPIYLNTPNWMHAEGILRRLMHFDIIWLDPSFNTFRDMKWACDMFLEEDTRHLNIMFHSSVIIPGGSPYTMNKKSTGQFFQRLEELLEYLLKFRGLKTATLKDFYLFRKLN